MPDYKPSYILYIQNCNLYIQN
uniref:Uncharacterized protein n=1 Tax=Anguilla anguilla TaxID=7936 RepID=A0A0E9XQ01_ANGAN